MTSNQINYAAHLEKVRSDLVNEALKRSELDVSKGELAVKQQEAQTKAYSATEAARANRAQEELTYRTIEANTLNNIRSVEATRYAAGTNYAASVYSSDVSRANTTDTIRAQEELRTEQAKTERTAQLKNVLTGVGNVVGSALKIVTMLS